MSFSILNAALCARVSSMAYKLATVESPLAHAFILEFADIRLAMLRGTYQPLDWFTDAKIRFVEYPKGSGLYVHAGFNESMLSIRGKLIDELTSRPKKPTIIGGHSKGAGEARQFIYGLTDSEADAIGFSESYTFGEPRNLGRAASLAYDRRFGAVTFRMVHQEDCVTHMPWLLGRYRHAGQRALLSSFGGCILNPSPATALASDIFGLVRAFDARRELGIFSEPIKDHFIDNYCAALPPATSPEKTVPA